MIPLESHLKDLFTSYRMYYPTYTTYRSKFIILDLPIINKNSNPLQRKLEKYRPTIDYIVLPTDQLLIGYTSDYSELTKVAIELSMQHLLDKQKEVLKTQHSLLYILKQHKENIPFSDKFPELFI